MMKTTIVSPNTKNQQKNLKMPLSNSAILHSVFFPPFLVQIARPMCDKNCSTSELGRKNILFGCIWIIQIIARAIAEISLRLLCYAASVAIGYLTMHGR